MTAYRKLIRDAAKSILAAANTIAGPRVYTGRTWPTVSGTGPWLLLYTFREEKVGVSDGGAPQFHTTLTLVVEARVEAADQTAASDALDDLWDQAEEALLTNPAFTRLFEKCVGVQTDAEFKGDAQKNYLRAAMALQLLYTETFDPVVTDDLAGVNLWVDAARVAFDRTGTYQPPFDYPVPAAPRDGGPDGRAETGGAIDLQS